ncbi:MAG: endoglucanase, partial [Mycobacteriales bacterium]
MRPLRASVLVLVALTAAGAASPAVPAVAGPRISALVRVDQLGYAPAESKQAYLMTSAASPGARFMVRDAAGRVVLSGQAGASLGSWNARYGTVYPLDFSRLHRPGTYRIAVAGLGALSAPFQVAPAGRLWQPRVADAVTFFQAQRDGRDV